MPDYFRLIVSKQHMIKAAARRCFSKQVILRIPQYSQENTCVEIFFNKVALKFFMKKRLQYRYFPVNIATRTAVAASNRP